MKTVGVDIGYGFLKVYDGEKFYIVPSVIGEAVKMAFEMQKEMGMKPSNKINLSKLAEVEVDGNSYSVGEFAILQSENSYRPISLDRATDGFLKVFFLLGLACSMGDLTEEDFHLVTGLPVKDFVLHKNFYVKEFTGTHEITINGVKRTINIQKVTVIPQPYGTFCDGLFEENGNVNEDFASQHVGIIDIGFKTSDFIQIKDYVYLEKYSSTSVNGMSYIYGEVKDYLHTNYSITKEDFELEEIIRKGGIKYNGTMIDLSEILVKSKTNLCKKISAEIKNKWPNFPELETIIISGGGGAMLFDYFYDILSENIVLTTEPQIANVRGYYNWGVYLDKVNKNN
jgi:plasmid segregation protein ParM